MEGTQSHLLWREMLRLASRNFRVNPVRAALTVLGMSVGFGVVVFLVSLGYGLQYILLGNLVTTQDSLVTVQVSYPGESGLEFGETDLTDLASLQNVAEVSPVGDFPGEVSLVGATSTAFTTISVVEPAYSRLSGMSVGFGKGLSTTTPNLILTNQALQLLSLATTSESLGTPLNVTVQYPNLLTGISEVATSTQPVSIGGIITDGGIPPRVFVTRRVLSSSPPTFQSVLIKADSLEAVSVLRDELVKKGLVVSAHIDLVTQARQITNAITIVLGVFGITALIVSAIGMFNTMIVSLMERTYEVGVLKSIGATDRDVMRLFLVEAILMGILGGLSGVMLGFTAAKMVNFGLNILATRYGGDPITLFITPVWFAVLTILISALIGLAAGFWPAYRASLLSPKQAFLRK